MGRVAAGLSEAALLCGEGGVRGYDHRKGGAMRRLVARSHEEVRERLKDWVYVPSEESLRRRRAFDRTRPGMGYDGGWSLDMSRVRW